MKILGKLFRSNSFWTAGCNLLTIGFSLIANILIARTMGATGRGELTTILVWSTVARAVFELGVPQGLTYLVARQPATAPQLFGSAIVIAISQSVLSFGLILVVGAIFLSQPTIYHYTLIYAVTNPAMSLITSLSAMMLGNSKIVWFNVLRLLNGAVLPLGCIPLLVSETAESTRFANLIVWLIVIQFLVLLIALIAGIRVFGVSFAHLLDNTKTIITQGIKSYWAGISFLLNNKLDQFLMSFLVSPEQLGLYSIAVSYTSVTMSVAGGMANLTFSKAAQSTDSQQARQIVQQSLRKGSLVIAGVSLVMAGLSPFLIPFVFGADFQASVPLSLILLVGGFVLGINYILSDGLRGLNKPEVPSKAEFYGLIFTVLGLMLLLPLLQAYGAALVSVLAYSLTLLILIRGFRASKH